MSLEPGDADLSQSLGGVNHRAPQPFAPEGRVTFDRRELNPHFQSLWTKSRRRRMA